MDETRKQVKESSPEQNKEIDKDMLSNKLQKVEYFSSYNNSNDGESLSISSKGSNKKKSEKEFKNEIFVQKLKWCRVWTIYMNIVYFLN